MERNALDPEHRHYAGGETNVQFGPELPDSRGMTAELLATLRRVELEKLLQQTNSDRMYELEQPAHHTPSVDAGVKLNKLWNKELIAPFANPEANDMADYSPYAYAFLRGLSDPMGLPSQGAHLLTKKFPDWSPFTTEQTRDYKRRVNEDKAQAPGWSSAGSGLASTLGVGSLAAMGLRAAGEVTAAEAAQLYPILVQMGLAGGGLAASLRNDRSPPRPQARYPTGGA